MLERLRMRTADAVPWIAYAWCLLLLVAILFTHLLNGDGWVYHLDLDDYLHAAASWANGTGLYGVTWVIGPSHAPMTFNYPPFAALVLSPLAKTSYPVAACLVTIGTLIALWVAGVCVVTVAKLSRRNAILAATMTATVGSFAYPVWSNLNLGQINVLLMAMAMVDVVAPWRWWPRGVLIGLAAAIKLTPLGLALYFVLKRDWRALATVLATAGVATAAAWIVDPQSSGQFWRNVLALKESVSVLGGSNVSLFGVAERVPSPAVRAIVLVGAVLFVGTLAVVAARNQLRHGSPLGAALAVALLVQFVSPVSWFHHWVWAVPVLLATLLAARGGDLVWMAVSAVSIVVLFSTLLGSVPGMWVLLIPWGVTVLAVMASRPLHLSPSRGEGPEGVGEAVPALSRPTSG